MFPPPVLCCDFWMDYMRDGGGGGRNRKKPHTEKRKLCFWTTTAVRTLCRRGLVAATALGFDYLKADFKTKHLPPSRGSSPARQDVRWKRDGARYPEPAAARKVADKRGRDADTSSHGAVTPIAPRLSRGRRERPGRREPRARRPAPSLPLPFPPCLPRPPRPDGAALPGPRGSQRPLGGARSPRGRSPGVELVDDALEADDGEEARAEAGQPGQEEDGEGEQRLPARRLRQAPRQAAPRPAAAVERRHGVGGGAGLVLAVGGRVLRHVAPGAPSRPLRPARAGRREGRGKGRAGGGREGAEPARCRRAPRGPPAAAAARRLAESGSASRRRPRQPRGGRWRRSGEELRARGRRLSGAKAPRVRVSAGGGSARVSVWRLAGGLTLPPSGAGGATGAGAGLRDKAGTGGRGGPIATVSLLAGTRWQPVTERQVLKRGGARPGGQSRWRRGRRGRERGGEVTLFAGHWRVREGRVLSGGTVIQWERRGAGHGERGASRPAALQRAWAGAAPGVLCALVAEAAGSRSSRAGGVPVARGELRLPLLLRLWRPLPGGAGTCPGAVTRCACGFPQRALGARRPALRWALG